VKAREQELLRTSVEDPVEAAARAALDVLSDG
jgi:hypothetical protein